MKWKEFMARKFGLSQNRSARAVINKSIREEVAGGARLLDLLGMWNQLEPQQRKNRVKRAVEEMGSAQVDYYAKKSRRK